MVGGFVVSGDVVGVDARQHARDVEDRVRGIVREDSVAILALDRPRLGRVVPTWDTSEPVDRMRDGVAGGGPWSNGVGGRCVSLCVWM